MNPEQAWQIIVNVLNMAKFEGSRADHVKVQEAEQVIGEIVKKLPKEEELEKIDTPTEE
jgi:hypothetical protein